MGRVERDGVGALQGDSGQECECGSKGSPSIKRRERELMRTEQGVQLVNEQQQGRFTFVDGSITSPNGNSLAQLYEAVDTALGDGGEGGHSVLLIVDDVSSLLWSGHSSSEVARFSAGLRALVARVSRPPSAFGAGLTISLSRATSPRVPSSPSCMEMIFPPVTMIQTTRISSGEYCSNPISGCRRPPSPLRLGARCAHFPPSSSVPRTQLTS